MMQLIGVQPDYHRLRKYLIKNQIPQLFEDFPSL